MAPPASAARALHDIIAYVEKVAATQQAPTPYHAWSKIVGHPVESAKFARFHAEVVELVSEVAEGLQLLTPSSRENYEQYLPAWWAAVVLPRRDWAAKEPSVIEPAALHMLRTLADLMEVRTGITGPGNPQGPDTLRRAIELLIAEFEKVTDLPLQVREDILADLRHVLWLLERVPTFGMDHAVAAAEKVTGKVIKAAATSGSPGVKAVVVGLTLAISAAVGPVADLTTIAVNVKELFGITAEAQHAGDASDVVQNTVVQVYNVLSPPKELAPGPDGDTGAGEEIAVVVDEEVATDR